MGAGNSKPEGQYVFAADSPVSFSSQVVESLQTSPETDSVRARNLELQVQARVAEELQKIRDTEAARLTSYTESLTPTSADEDSSEQQSLGSRIADAVTPSAFKDSTASHGSVNKEVADLRAKLERRRQRDDATDKGVEGAKDELVKCLRLKDRRPLDCWEEVEKFKGEVARLEQKFVDKALR
ncbi:hypothetical protein AAFC00_003676 [Neodothiora populina]|uniref:MICOS complex subunit mic19 n=1 Tax=Neodothiora populina TaxID=2781224 RepID=A0ABR3PG65_9PEZI